MRWLTWIAVGAMLATGTAARASSRPAISVRVSPALAGAPGQVSLKTAFDSAVLGELDSYEIDLARGFAFDARGVTSVCGRRALESDSCASSSRIGTGTGRIAVQGKYLPRTEYAVSISFYLTAARHRGDLAGVLLDLDEPQSALSVALLGRVVALGHGIYGLALRFSNTARELPSGFDLTLARLQIQLGTAASHAGTSSSLLTNPRSCPRAGWPLAISIRSARTTQTYGTSTPCTRG